MALFSFIKGITKYSVISKSTMHVHFRLFMIKIYFAVIDCRKPIIIFDQLYKDVYFIDIPSFASHDDSDVSTLRFDKKLLMSIVAGRK